MVRKSPPREFKLKKGQPRRCFADRRNVGAINTSALLDSQFWFEHLIAKYRPHSEFSKTFSLFPSEMSVFGQAASETLARVLIGDSILVSQVGTWNALHTPEVAFLKQFRWREDGCAAWWNGSTCGNWPSGTKRRALIGQLDPYFRRRAGRP